MCWHSQPDSKPSAFAPYSCFANARQEIVAEVFRKTFSLLSIIGSSYIVADVIRTRRNDKATDPYQRIMLCLGTFDILFSSVCFLGTWLTPKETGWLWSVGNTSSCSTQGFFTVLGLMGEFLYQMALSLNALILIVFGWNQEKFAEKVEKPLHTTIITVALTTALVPLAYQSYNPSCGTCWSMFIADKCSDGEECIVRGSRTVFVAYSYIQGATLFIMNVFCTVAMVWVYLHVRRQELKMQEYNFRGHNEEHHRESKRIRKILLLYTLSLYLTWGVYAVTANLYIFLSLNIPFFVRVLFESSLPSSLGFFNMLVYFLPNSLKYQEDHPGTWLVTSYFHVLHPSTTRVEDSPDMNNLSRFNTSTVDPIPFHTSTEQPGPFHTSIEQPIPLDTTSTEKRISMNTTSTDQPIQLDTSSAEKSLEL